MFTVHASLPAFVVVVIMKAILSGWTRISAYFSFTSSRCVWMLNILKYIYWVLVLELLLIYWFLRFIYISNSVCKSHTHMWLQIFSEYRRGFCKNNDCSLIAKPPFSHLNFIFGGWIYAFISSVHLLTALFEFQCSVLLWDLHIFWTLSFCQHKFITSTDFSLTL